MSCAGKWGASPAGQGTAAGRNDLPRESVEAPLPECAGRKLDETYRQINPEGCCLVAKRLGVDVGGPFLLTGCFKLCCYCGWAGEHLSSTWHHKTTTVRSRTRCTATKRQSLCVVKSEGFHLRLSIPLKSHRAGIKNRLNPTKLYTSAWKDNWLLFSDVYGMNYTLCFS